MSLMPNISKTFAVLGNTTRFAIVERLLKEGELSAGEFLGDGRISPPAISRHFKVLREAGVISQRIDAQRRLYSVRPQAVRAIGEWSMSYREFWEGGMDRLAVALAQESQKNE
jgi:DNA-binding transcriptional ArsR family regulator